MTPDEADPRRGWFANCGGWFPRRDLGELRCGIAAGLLDERDEYGMTALHLAVASGWREGVEELLGAGADTETRHFRTGETPLKAATNDLGTGNGERLNSAALVALLVAAGANPDAANHFGMTPRRLAAGRFPDGGPFASVPEGAVQMPEPRIQNVEHLADHYRPRFRIPKREERESMRVGQAVDLYVYGPKVEGKQDTVKVRITACDGPRPGARFTAVVETPVERTHLPAGTTSVEFGPEHIASVYVPRTPRKRRLPPG